MASALFNQGSCFSVCRESNMLCGGEINGIWGTNVDRILYNPLRGLPMWPCVINHR